MIDYLKEYSESNKNCQYPNCNLIGVWRRQNTQYHEDKMNWACLCEEHQKETDVYWRDQWTDYYNSVI